jgi:glucokinase
MSSGAPPVLAVVVDPGRLAAAIVDRRGEVVVRDRVTTPNRDVWRTLAPLVQRVLAARPADVDEPVAAGVCCTGPVDLAAGAVSPIALPAWSAFPLREHLMELTGLPTALDTYAGAVTAAERWVGDAVDVDSFVTIVCDQTVESACVLEGRRIGGAHGNAGSIGHLNVEPGGRSCICGSHGCLSSYASASAIEAEMNRPLRRSTSSTMEQAGIMLGRAIASTTAVFDVTHVFLTGSVVDTFGDAMLGPMRREIEFRVRLEHLTRLTVAELSGFVQPLVGAAAVALQQAERVTAE